MTGAAAGRRLLEANVLTVHAREPWLSTRDLAVRCRTSQSMVVRVIRLDRLRHRDSNDVTHPAPPPVGADSGGVIAIRDWDRIRAVEFLPCSGCGRALLPEHVAVIVGGSPVGGDCFACWQRARGRWPQDDLEMLLA